MSRLRSILLVLGLAIVLLGGFLLNRESDWLEHLADQAVLRRFIDSLGTLGPAAVIGLLALAIVMSPIPSAPIAIVAGAAYGPIWGTVFTVAGSELGAVIAFVVARYFAYDAVRRWETIRRSLDWFEKGHSQRWLMAAVFVSRLLPFISFDAISYAAGVTPLKFWRFVVATLTGVIPISFLLAYGGDTLLFSGETDPVLTLLALGGITLVPFIVRFLWIRLKRGEHK